MNTDNKSKPGPQKQDPPPPDPGKKDPPPPAKPAKKGRAKGQSLKDWTAAAKTRGNVIIHTGKMPIEVPAKK